MYWVSPDHFSNQRMAKLTWKPGTQLNLLELVMGSLLEPLQLNKIRKNGPVGWFLTGSVCFLLKRTKQV